MRIEVLGPGCAKCRAAEENIRSALAQFECEAEVVKVLDVKEFARRGVSFTPAVIINGRVRASGRVPAVPEIITWLADAAQENQPAGA